MNRSLLLGAATGFFLFGCATYDGMTEQQLSDTYFSCIYLEASRNNETMSEGSVRAAHGACHEDVWPYAKALVIIVEPGLREEFVSSRAIVLLADLADEAVLTMRQSGVIK